MSESTDTAKAAVTAILESAGFAFSVTYSGEQTRDGWQCDGWLSTFAKQTRENPAKPYATYSFPYYTGLGLRTEPGPKEKAEARWKVPGVTENDIKRGTIYGRRYFAEIEKLRKPKAPHAADILYGLITDASAVDSSFINWCADYGYDSDSIKALNTYNQCCETGQKIRVMFTRDQIAALREALQDY